MQFQRTKHKDPETGEEFINTEIEDIELANELMKEAWPGKSENGNASILTTCATTSNNWCSMVI